MKLQLSVFLLAITSITALEPKMVGQPVEDSNRRLKDKASKKKGSQLASHNAIYTGTCSSGGTFSFMVGGGSGKGTVALLSDESGKAHPVLTFDDNCKECLGDIVGDAEPNVFGFEDGVESGSAFPLEYKGIPREGATLTLACDIDSDVLVILKDTNTDRAEDVEADVSWSRGKNGKIREFIRLSNGKMSQKSITAVAKQNGNRKGEKKNSESKNVWISEESSSSIMVEHNMKDEVVLINMEVRDSTGNTVPRTFVLETSDEPPEVFNFAVEKIGVNDDGDLELNFKGQPKDARYLYQVRIGLQSKNKKPVDVVDYSAIIDANEESMTIHGSWIRKTIDDMRIVKKNGDIEAFDIVITEGIGVDPNDGYQQVAELEMSSIVLSAAELPMGSDEYDSTGGKLRRLLSRPSDEETGAITMEMLQGRKPEVETTGLRRRLAGPTKLLVHGYCGTNPFPTSHFSNEVAFSVAGSGSNQWSHDTFAQNIDSFGNSYSSCGIIAHSQGGAAALHLYTYYWSCLDNASSGGSRLIQTVGSPYQGTALAGVLAALGNIFGAGCGIVNDLTYSGASSWLNNIPSWARSKVYYHTTSFETKWWRWDYCNVASDLVLGDPEDGTTEKSKGQLPGANNLGHATKQCHTTGMRDPPQCENQSRNSNMNSNAKY